MYRRPPRVTLNDPLLPSTTLFRSSRSCGPGSGQRRPGWAGAAADGLQFGIGVQTGRGELAAQATRLRPTERRTGVKGGEGVAVDEHRASVEPTGEQESALFVRGPDRGG